MAGSVVVVVVELVVLVVELDDVEGAELVLVVERSVVVVGRSVVDVEATASESPPLHAASRRTAAANVANGRAGGVRTRTKGSFAPSTARLVSPPDGWR